MNDRSALNWVAGRACGDGRREAVERPDTILGKVLRGRWIARGAVAWKRLKGDGHTRTWSRNCGIRLKRLDWIVVLACSRMTHGRRREAKAQAVRSRWKDYCGCIASLSIRRCRIVGCCLSEPHV